MNVSYLEALIYYDVLGLLGILAQLENISRSGCFSVEDLVYIHCFLLISSKFNAKYQGVVLISPFTTICNTSKRITTLV